MSQKIVGKVVLLLLLHAGIVGCKLIPTASPTIPMWVSQPPSNDQNFTVTGSGVSLYEATQNARHNMAALILADVNSQMSIRATQDGDYAREIITLKASVDVSDIPLKHANVERQQRVGNTFYVLMNMPKGLFSQQLIAQNESIERRAVPILTSGLTRDFEGWWVLHKLNGDINEMERNLALLRALNNDDLPHQADIVTNYFKQLEASRENRQLAIRNTTRDKSFAAIIEDQLSSHSIETGSRHKNQSSIQIALEFQRQSLGREIHIKGQLNIVLLAPNGQVRSQTSLRAQTVSITKVADGQNKIKRMLAEQLAQTDVISQLFEV